jgi:hypothetical protein
MTWGSGLAILAATGALAAAPPPTSATPPPGATIYLMDQIATGPLPPEVLKAMEPLHTLDAVEALLKSKKIAFAWREAEVSSAVIDPRVVDQVASLPAGEVLVAPQGEGWIMSVVLSARPAAAEPAPAPFPPLAAPPAQRPRIHKPRS